MNIPTITTTAPFPYCRQYASHAIAESPSFDRTVNVRPGEVSFEYACFLIREGEWEREHYINLILEDERTHAEIEARIAKHVGIIEPDELIYQIYEIIYKAELNAKIDQQIKTDNSGWEDYE